MAEMKAGDFRVLVVFGLEVNRRACVQVSGSVSSQIASMFFKEAPSRIVGSFQSVVLSFDIWTRSAVPVHLCKDHTLAITNV
ncbi:hypothetical protein E2542_SST14871 [Spatholobus suberectus]|nr:hypothetical protein E2542_SST14871 [Spatholobus suberectus]